MSFTKEQQIERLFQKSEHTLILLPSTTHGDHVGAAWALAYFLENQGKTVSIAGRRLSELKARYDFLSAPSAKHLETLSGLRDFVLSFATKHNNILHVRTESEADEYRIFVTPEHGAIDPRDFSILPVRFRYDCLVVLGSPDKESLGALYTENPDIFYEVPIINIDHHSENESYGQINLTEMTASSVSEIVADILERLAPDTLSEPMAECLLMGIMTATDSFQKKNTTPKTLALAARLMDRGADQQKIVRHIFKTQPFHLLKLWGSVMAGLAWDETLGLLSSSLTTEQLKIAGASPDDIPAVLEKVRNAYSSGKWFLILFQDSEQHIRGYLEARSNDMLDQMILLWPNSAREGELLLIDFSDNDLAQAEASFIAKLPANPPKKTSA